MDFDLPAGSYVVAVSGGVDSIALLHMLAQRPNLQLVVAHYDHGVRLDSMIDRTLVQLTAKRYGLPFVYENGRLGPHASEAVARTARYGFLHKVRQASGARAIITAHHQDDVLETAVLNLLRGTGRRGLSSLQSLDGIRRPLLHMPKKELLRYATEQGLDWREDSTNTDVRYLRNHIRHNLLPRFAGADREALLAIIAQAAEHNALLTEQLANYLHVQPGTHRLDRHDFIGLPHLVARDVMAEWLLLRTGAELNRLMVERLVVAAKTARTGSRADVDKRYWLRIGRDNLALELRER
ncbi:MAG TPA: tRNA lysidine(34) synthetase TilS [Candidatus Saccharimonadales bacterium]|nr:tRNA lysidine(34) synthetase TilS [Candidatus Saccharimonadales bacterium]